MESKENYDDTIKTIFMFMWLIIICKYIILNNNIKNDYDNSLK